MSIVPLCPVHGTPGRVHCAPGFLAHLWCAYAIPLALSVVRRPSSVVCVVSSNLNTADMKEII